MTDLLTDQTSTSPKLPEGEPAVRQFLKEYPGIVSAVLRQLRKKRPRLNSGVVYRVLYGHTTSEGISRAILREKRRRDRAKGKRAGRRAA